MRLPENYWLILLMLFSCNSTGGLDAQNRSAKPNVIFILSDDQGSVDAGCYGSVDLLTPNIDRIARKGVRFTQFYANAPICSPSRAAILTGKTPFGAGVPGNVASVANQQKGMPQAEITMADMFKANGYRTAAIGKWHLGYTPQLQPQGQGFDYHFGHLVGCIDNYSHFYFWNGPNRHDLYRNGEEIYRDGEYFPAMCLEEASTFIEEESDQPFFIYFAMNTPHYPYQGHARWIQHYDQEGVPYPRNIYNAFLSTQDEYIGLLLDKLDELEIADETLIIYQSDHGHSTEERAHFGGGSSGPYKGAKGSLFEGGLRVPAIISWPNQLPQNQVRNQWSMASDWFPTLNELCRLDPINHPIAGKSLAGVIQDSGAPEVHTEWHWQFQQRWSIRNGEWKLLYDPLDTSEKRNPDPNGPEDEYFLVNLHEDLGESNNLAGSQPEKVKELLERYHQRKLEEIQPIDP